MQNIYKNNFYQSISSFKGSNKLTNDKNLPFVLWFIYDNVLFFQNNDNNINLLKAAN